MTRRRKFVFALIAMLLGASVTSVAVLAADLYVHHRAQNSAGLNRWGYRGPVVPRKVPGEVRIVMVGGSTVFGYGGKWHEAPPARLEAELRSAHPGDVINVVNLGYNNDGAFAAKPTLEDYRYLDYDAVILYEGYNDRQGDFVPNTQVYRRQSVVFRLTGYSPILPMAFTEAARRLRSGGTDGNAPVFSPNLAARTSATAMEAANAVGEMLGRQLEQLSAAPARTRAYGTECAAPWSHYCAVMVQATRYARSIGAKVLIVTQPIYPNEKNIREEGDQQAKLAAAIQQAFPGDRDVRFLDLSKGIDLTDPQMSFDSMHLGPPGNQRLAQLMLPAVEELVWAK
jgi:hypothetical protein